MSGKKRLAVSDEQHARLLGVSEATKLPIQELVRRALRAYLARFKGGE